MLLCLFRQGCKGAIKYEIISTYSVSVSESTKSVGIFDTSTYTGTKGYLKNCFIVLQNRDYEHAEWWYLQGGYRM